MPGYLKIVVAVMFFVLLKKEHSYNKHVDLKNAKSTEVKLCSEGDQNGQSTDTKILVFKIKRKCKATENVTMHFIFSGIGRERDVENDFRINSIKNYKAFYKNNLQRKRGPPLL